jgi:hypothetical protein
MLARKEMLRFVQQSADEFDFLQFLRWLHTGVLPVINLGDAGVADRAVRGLWYLVRRHGHLLHPLFFMVIAAIIAVRRRISWVGDLRRRRVRGSLMFLLLYARYRHHAGRREVLGLIILIRATIARPNVHHRRAEFFRLIVSVAISSSSPGGHQGLRESAAPGRPFANVPEALLRPTSKGLADTGAANVVAGVILTIAAMTLGPRSFTSILGATVIWTLAQAAPGV